LEKALTLYLRFIGVEVESVYVESDVADDYSLHAEEYSLYDHLGEKGGVACARSNP